MEQFGKLILGLFIGALCGLVPLLYGYIKKNIKLAIISIVITSVSGLIFAIFGKPPFTALVVGFLFVLIIIANNKRNSHSSHDNDDFDNDI